INDRILNLSDAELVTYLKSLRSENIEKIEVITSTPLVKVDDNTGVSIVGKSGVAVMINDRILNLSDAELVTYLKSLRSENIEKIEVITS
ncbi:hypothetical protein BOQ60_25835, partial [Chryseobacterium sp. CH1]